MDFKVLVILMMMIVCSASLATFVAPTHSHPEDGFYDDHMASGLNSVSEDFVLNGRNLLEEGHRIPLWMDVHALLSFKKDIKDPSGKLSNWTIENWEAACSWYGVTCTHHNPRVVAIILPRLNLTGTISPSIGGLSFLYTLNLSSNYLTGEIPPEIGQLKALRILDLTGIYQPGAYSYGYEYDNNNQLLLLSGSIPKSLSNCTSLQYIGFAWNNFTGTIPTEFGRLVHLEQLDLGYNKFTGTIPTEFGRLAHLEQLDLGYNKFTGTIPTVFGRLVHLEQLDLGYNSLGGRIPHTLSNCSEIPASIGSLSSLRLLNLSWNQLEGKIPASLGTIHTLEQLDLSENNLSGGIPQNLSTLTMLAIMDVSSNNLCGPIPEGILMSTYLVTSFQRNKCLCGGFRLSACKKNEIKLVEGVSGKRNVTEWLCSVDEKISLIALGIGMVIGFGGVLLVFLACKTTRDWMVPPHKPKSFYGEYRLPT